MLTRLDVIQAYQSLLGRAPESEAVIEDHRRFGSTAELIAAVIGSREYQDRFAREHGLAAADRPSFPLERMDEAVAVYQAGPGPVQAEFAGSVLALPDWFDHALDPDGEPYRAQMLRLWAAITGRADYDPDTHEDTPEVAAQDALYRPAFYATRDVWFAGSQIMAMGHILVRSGVTADARILEYGAGFGQTALAFARMGAKVDTVDINPAFCRAVGAAAERYRVDLTPHCRPFGYNPAGEDHAYDLVFFYESFHHCLDFAGMIRALPRLLKPGGRVLLAGEPIFPAPAPDMPYPWGFRLDWENVAIMRTRGWLELGFRRDYLVRHFEEAGFAWHFHEDVNSHWAKIYEFGL